jgi:hypothetical protein
VLPCAACTQQFASHHLTLFTSQRFILLPAYIYQKDKRAHSGKLKSSRLSPPPSQLTVMISVVPLSASSSFHLLFFSYDSLTVRYRQRSWTSLWRSPVPATAARPPLSTLPILGAVSPVNFEIVRSPREGAAPRMTDRPTCSHNVTDFWQVVTFCPLILFVCSCDSHNKRP